MKFATMISLWVSSVICSMSVTPQPEFGNETQALFVDLSHRQDSTDVLQPATFTYGQYRM